MILEYILRREDGTIILKDTIDAFEIYKAPIEDPIVEGDSALEGFTFLPLILGDKRKTRYMVTYSDWVDWDDK